MNEQEFLEALRAEYRKAYDELKGAFSTEIEGKLAAFKDVETGLNSEMDKRIAKATEDITAKKLEDLEAKFGEKFRKFAAENLRSPLGGAPDLAKSLGQLFTESEGYKRAVQETHARKD